MNSERTGDISPRTGHSVSFTNTIIVIVVRRGEVEELMLDTQCALTLSVPSSSHSGTFVGEVLLSWLFNR